MTGRIVVTRQEMYRARVLGEVVSGRITLKEAVKYLKVTYRHARRLKGRFLQGGLAGLVHGNRGRTPPNAVPDWIKQRVVSLCEQRYSEFNDTHVTEMLHEHEAIILSRETVRVLLRTAGRPPKRSRRPARHRSRRAPREQAGMMIQWDGSPHRWFGPLHPPCCLLAAVDDADGSLLAALCVPAESSVGYLRLLAMILHRHGIPLAIYHDRHSCLVRTDDYWSLEEQLQGTQYPTHVGRVLEELGIESIPAYSPQAKGRIERRFGVLQDRMIAEMHLAGITDITTANRWLEEIFIERYNTRFVKKALQDGSAFIPICPEDIHHSVCFAYETPVSNDNCVRLGGITIDLPPDHTGRSFAKYNVLVRHHLDGTWSVWLGNRRIGTHEATEFKEPLRSWKKRHTHSSTKAKELLQLYVTSKPAPAHRGLFPSAVKGTY